MHQNPTVVYDIQNNASGYQQPQQSHVPHHGHFNGNFANYDNQYTNQSSFLNPTNIVHQQIVQPSLHQNLLYNGQNNSGYQQPLRSHMPPAYNSLFIFI